MDGNKSALSDCPQDLRTEVGSKPLPIRGLWDSGHSESLTEVIGFSRFIKRPGTKAIRDLFATFSIQPGNRYNRDGRRSLCYSSVSLVSVSPVVIPILGVDDRILNRMSSNEPLQMRKSKNAAIYVSG